MNTFAIDVWLDEGRACSFYTVRWDDGRKEQPSETDKFFDRYAISGHEYEKEAYMLFRLISSSIGDKYGAIDDFFDRHENEAQALPPRPKKWVEEIKEIGVNFPLRLYCYRISEKIVILFDGGVKEAGTAQESKSLSMKFYEAQRFAMKIRTALQSGTIRISEDGRQLESFDGRTEIIL